MYCSQCGKELPDNSKFCQQCGSPVSETTNVQSKKSIDINRVINKLKTKKGVTFGIIALCLLIVVLIIVGRSPNREQKPIEEHLLGEWVAANDNGESSIVFERDEDEYVGEWTVYDYRNKEWEEIDFTIKDIDNHIMTILLSDGDMEYVPFAVSKDTLIFADTEYKNKDKDVPIPTDEYAYILDGVIRPVTMSCYMGMSKDEAAKAIPYTLEHSYGDTYYCELPESEYGDIRLQLRFDDEYELNEITYWIGDEYYDDKSGLVDHLSDLYGDYTKEQWSTQENYYHYIWESGNLVITLNDNTEDDSLWIEYRISTDWYLEYRRNNKD